MIFSGQPIKRELFPDDIEASFHQGCLPKQKSTSSKYKGTVALYISDIPFLRLGPSWICVDIWNWIKNPLKGWDEVYYHKFSIKGVTPYKGAGPPILWHQTLWVSGRFWLYSQPKMVRFSFCKKPLDDENVPYLMMATLRACLRARRP